jgi:hypothetical protein
MFFMRLEANREAVIRQIATILHVTETASMLQTINEIADLDLHSLTKINRKENFHNLQEKSNASSERSFFGQFCPLRGTTFPPSWYITA